jgi:hypothetical protein
MKSTKWIKIFFGLSLLGILFVGGVNYVIDPGFVYYKKESEISSDEYAKNLQLSKNGLVAEGWNERAIKLSLAKFSGEYDCVVMGSSHVMQISGLRNTGNISTICSKLLNLGVSGGSLEDLFIFSSVIFSNKKNPKQVFIDISPWLFKYNMDERWQKNKEYYDEFISILNNTLMSESEDINLHYKIELFQNLFNLEYFITSLKSYDNLSDKSIIEEPLHKFSFEDGYIKAITLQDGSHLYDSNFINKAKKNILNLKNGGGGYKINGDVYSKDALKLFERLISFYQKNNIQVNFIITPYHPAVFKSGDTQPVHHMKEVENIAKQLANKYNINLYGSFFSRKIRM